MTNFKATVYEDTEKTKEVFKGICIAISGIYCYCVEKGTKDITKVSTSRVDYEG